MSSSAAAELLRSLSSIGSPQRLQSGCFDNGVGPALVVLSNTQEHAFICIAATLMVLAQAEAKIVRAALRFWLGLLSRRPPTWR